MEPTTIALVGTGLVVGVLYMQRRREDDAEGREPDDATSGPGQKAAPVNLALARTVSTQLR
jgi:hypothetical protein